MRWSKVKKKIEDNFAESLNNQIKVFFTKYTSDYDAGDLANRAWITVNEQEVVNFSTLEAFKVYFCIFEVNTIKMAKPKIFLSSTYYDLKHIRASMDLFIESLGFEAILSEKGDIAYSHDKPLDESCYNEVLNTDILILIIGGRYGSEISNGDKKLNKSFYDKYESVTKKEYETAINKDTPTYILIESNVYSEYRTYLKNKGNTTINFAHVDSVNIFNFIEEILSRPRNNPVFSFEKFEQIEHWLKEQWAGLFRDLLNKKSQQTQIKSLSSEINELQEVNKTLKTYLEAVMSGMSKDDTNKLIEKEKERLKNVHIKKLLEDNKFFKQISVLFDMDFETYIDIQLKAKNINDFIEICRNSKNGDELSKSIEDWFNFIDTAQEDFNESREILGLQKFKFKEYNNQM